MKMSDVKLVKVDNWGIYFLQRLKHFFNRTDYCDLTLQFQDNAQLKVHRLVLSACTEYFELLERTCEMYEDCLVMPDDLQADVVVPIVNFMYTGQLEFRMDLLDRLYQTSEIMNMPVLTKLLNSHRPKHKTKVQHSYPVKRVPKLNETLKVDSEKEAVQPSSSGVKRSYSNAFDKNIVYKDKKYHETQNKKSLAVTNKGVVYKPPSPIPYDVSFNKKCVLGDPRPTRYELPEELDTDNIFESSFCNISYTSQPLMVHPETRKQYAKRPRQIGESSSKGYGTTTVDIVECKKLSKNQEDSIFEDTMSDSITAETEMFQPFVKIEPTKDSSQLFDQIAYQNDDVAKVTIETTKSKKTPNTANLDHAKIISEVLKKYPHLVKSNKNIKLKILNTQSKTSKKSKVTQSNIEKAMIMKNDEPDFTYDDVLDSKQAAKLIEMGADNVDGPWICLICGTPGRALQFTSYFKYRKHLVENHNEKPVLTRCEYCGQKCNKINYLLYHMYTKHGIEPPPQYHFPKCNKCDYIALTEALLIKHSKNHTDGKSYHNYVALAEALATKPQSLKLSERKTFQCSVCTSSFKTSNHLLSHIQMTGHKYKKPNLQCIYCMKTFSRESNFYAHLKIHHKNDAIGDGIIDDSDEEKVEQPTVRQIKCETPVNDYEEVDVQYQIQQRPDGIHVVTKKQSESPTNTKQKILNAGFSTPVEVEKSKPSNFQDELMQELNITTANDTHESSDVIKIDNTEYLLKGNKLVHRKPKQVVAETIIPDIKPNLNITTLPVEFTQSSSISGNVQVTEIMKTSSLGQPISIYVSNEEEYKALMSANHPIIFDPDDSNKSLTVLTAPHPETLDTTAIDLDNTHPNDMMIIQDGYPLNVTETVATENSNIVVVYSHDVDQNKEYQLLTTQGLEPQFVQSSAIITQNFETVTTSTPVMSAHVLGTQIEESWQNANIHQDINNQPEQTPSETILHQTIPCQDVEMENAIEQNTDMADLPEVEIPHNKTEQSKISITDNINNEILLPPMSENITEVISDDNITAVDIQQPTEDVPQIINNDNLTSEENSTMESFSEIPSENSIIETIPPAENIIESSEQQHDDNIPNENISSISEETEVHAEEIMEETPIVENNTEPITYEENHLTNHESPNVNEVVLHPDNQEMDEQVVTTQNTETIQQEAEGIEEVIQENTEFVENEQVISTPITDEDDTVTTEDTNPGDDISMNNDVSHPVETIEKIQTLASEWSEDSETASQDNTDLVNKDNIVNKESEMEESIENIQQEVVRQLAETPVTVVNNETESDTVDENDPVTNDSKLSLDEINKEESTKIIEPPPTPRSKIKSLLNDWDDNYSQDDVVADEDKMEISKEKIKSIVSDWDDEDEEK